jgi:GNAT superfamily N-acetyltransferase
MELKGWPMSSFPEVSYSHWTGETLPSDLMPLVKAACDEGYRFLARLEDEWRSGALRFAGPGECLFIAEAGNRLVGIGGICRDPYQSDDAVGRLRHLYVDRPSRFRGIGRGIVCACLAYSRAKFRVIRLSINAINPTAGRFYEQLGFRPIAVDGERATHLLSTAAGQISN